MSTNTMSNCTTIYISSCPTCGGPAQFVAAECSETGEAATLHVDLAEYNRAERQRLADLVELAAAYIERQPCLQTAEEAPAARQLVARLRASPVGP